jgi:hypothetical protein
VIRIGGAGEEEARVQYVVQKLDTIYLWDSIIIQLLHLTTCSYSRVVSLKLDGRQKCLLDVYYSSSLEDCY